MFKRRVPLTRLQRTREALWPSMGWFRAGKYMFHRLIRLSDTTHKIAGGLATGVALSFSPLVGTHFLQCVIACFVLRVNLLSAFVGTAAGNPWTLPFMWWASYEVGKRIFGLFGWVGTYPAPTDHMTFGVLWDMIRHHPLDIFLPWMVGGYLIGFIAWFPAYILFYGIVYATRQARRQVKIHKIHKAAQEVTGQSEA